MKKILIAIVILSVIIPLIFSGSLSFQKKVTKKSEYKPVDWFYQQRAFPFDHINKEIYQKSLTQSKELATDKSKSLGTWEFAGPNNIGGRLTDVEVHPSDGQQIFLGTASGGVFKSSDAGETFIPVFDENLSLSIGDIAIAPGNAETIYVGTGEANPGGGSLAYDGNGVYKSTSGGNNWSHLGLEEIGSVGRIVVSPQNSNIAYVAAMGYLFENNPDRGVYKTTDGGENWSQILYLNDSTGAIDLAIHPINPDTVYAVMWERVRRLEYFTYGGWRCGIYRTYDGGQNWIELEDNLPSGPNVGRIGIGISQSDPNILYAIYADKTGYFDGLFKSMDGGDSWVQTNDSNLSNLYASYGWWFGRLKIDPQNPDNVYAIGLELYKTSDGGDSWQEITGSAHVDQHEVAISPQNSDLVYLANDGGFYISENGGNSWSHNKTLPITQFYTAEIDATAPYRVYGGTQDNGTNRTLSGNPDAWAQIYGGDGFYCIVDPNDARYVYAEYQYGNLARSTNYGSNFSSATTGINSNDRKNWNTPVVMNPLNSSSLYYGSHRLYKSLNKAINWSSISEDLTNGPGGGNQKYGTITTISVSAADTNIIYVGTDDANVWVSLDNGNQWNLISENLPQRWISRVIADPMEANMAYVCLSGFRENEYMPHVFKTDDYGLSWQDISTGLPEAPVNDLVIWPDVIKRLIVATDVGVFYQDEGENEWHMFADGLPLVPVTDLALDFNSGTIAAATFGRSMYAISLSVGEEESTVKQTEHQINIYPNPASNFVWIENFMSAKELQVFDRQGRWIQTQKLNSGIQELELQLKPGLYIFNFIGDEVHYSQKCLIN
mgnify:CR=1 FL=1